MVSPCEAVRGSSSEIPGEVGTPDVADNRQLAEGAGGCRGHLCTLCVSLHGRAQEGAVFASPGVHLLKMTYSQTLMFKWFTTIHICIFKTSVITELTSPSFPSVFLSIRFHLHQSSCIWTPSKSPGHRQAFTHQCIGTPQNLWGNGEN